MSNLASWGSSRVSRVTFDLPMNLHLFLWTLKVRGEEECREKKKMSTRDRKNQTETGSLICYIEILCFCTTLLSDQTHDFT